MPGGSRTECDVFHFLAAKVQRRAGGDGAVRRRSSRSRARAHGPPAVAEVASFMHRLASANTTDDCVKVVLKPCRDVTTKALGGPAERERHVACDCRSRGPR